MCESPYNIKWPRVEGRCPNLVDPRSGTGFGVQVQYTPFFRHFPSLAHMWSFWHREYYEADFPRLMIRFEDLLLRPQVILEHIQECVQAEWTDDKVSFVTEAVKESEYFRKYKEQSGMVSGLVKYGQDNGRRTYSMQPQDIDFAEQALDAELMELFHYARPSR